MFLKEKYGADDLKYRYLEPESTQESAVIVKLSELYPHLFELITERETAGYKYKLRIKIKENAPKEKI